MKKILFLLMLGFAMIANAGITYRYTALDGQVHYVQYLPLGLTQTQKDMFVEITSTISDGITPYTISNREAVKQILLADLTCPEGYEGTPPNCTEIVPETCPEGYEGTPPNCTEIVVNPPSLLDGKVQCGQEWEWCSFNSQTEVTRQVWFGDENYLAGPITVTGFGVSCQEGNFSQTDVAGNKCYILADPSQPQTCPEGYEGTPPNCTEIVTETCPAGYEGTPPNCNIICEEGFEPNGTGDACVAIQPETCPEGYEGTPPNCTEIVPETCPEGTMGTPPNCTPHSMTHMPYVNRALEAAPNPVTTSSILIGPTPAGWPPISNSTTGGEFRLNGVFAKFDQIDPIVNPNQEMSMHHHTFLCNTDVTKDTTNEVGNDTLRQGRSTCNGGGANLSSYWTPSLIDTTNGQPLKPSYAVIYYKTGHPDSVTVPPSGLKMVAGRANATPTDRQMPQPTWSGPEVVRFTCNEVYTGHQDHIPPCSGDLNSMVVFPHCWDGQNLYKPDQSHMSYGDQHGNCGGSHPVSIPILSINTHYNVNGTSNLRLASDNYEVGAGGYSSHADWMNGWDMPTLTQFVNNCLKARKDCHTDQLGNGQAMYFQ